ncbi:hypothetical protein SDC9_35373 [bioreactor metagenome]|uniref:Uncharacterized protein n=1 Tax=bioreactor metagenome TaxID=1076179 RepID=A0A644VD94_9ZZZZ
METVQRTFLYFVFSYFFREFRVMDIKTQNNPKHETENHSRKSKICSAEVVRFQRPTRPKIRMENSYSILCKNCPV